LSPGCSSCRNIARPQPDRAVLRQPKLWLRNAAKRTPEAVGNGIGRIVDTVSRAECRNYFLNAGMNPPDFIPL
jgi:hypothetical protein